jgi:uncharacterized protein YkwD
MRARVIVVVTALSFVGCQTTGGSSDGRDGAGPGGASGGGEIKLPSWLGAPADVVRSPELEEAASLLCVRDTDAVIDDEARNATGIADGQVFGIMKKAPTENDAVAQLGPAAAALLVDKRATHAGVFVGERSGEACAAMVGVRRVVVIGDGLRGAGVLRSGESLALDVKVPRGLHGTLYTLKPDGFVLRTSLPAAGGAQRVTVPSSGGDGRYVAEIVVDKDEGPSDPEVALLWPFVVGKPKDAPFPEVLFPDEGHDDTALTHRAEALVQRLRNEQLIEPFKVSPPLVEIAKARAQAVAERGALGHRLPAAGSSSSTDALQDLRARFGDEPRAQFLRLAEVQAQASTLAEAWQAMLDSPAHRYELVDTAYTHCGVAVSRGVDGAGRPTVTMVALLARRPPNRNADDVRAQILEMTNQAREKRGLNPVVESSHLNRVATRLANAMRDQGKVDDSLLGGPVAKVALEADASLTKVKPLVARSDDPMLLVQNGPPALLMDIDVAQGGVGMAMEPTTGVFYVVILAGE